MKTLVHICCAPCLLAPLQTLRGQGVQLQGLFYNPNIHPFLEFRKRIKALRALLESDPLAVDIDEDYGLDLFMEEVRHPTRADRCRNCYTLRLTHAARRALEGGIEAFTTTLLVSPHQDHDLIRCTGEQVGRDIGVPFLYQDFRPLHDRSHELARERHLYRQPYCGCCFSEYERFKDTSRELYRGPSAGKETQNPEP